MKAREREALLKPGMRAADLGAAPGGWTWVLVRADLHVVAIDNGPLREHVLASGQVTHLREDGFRWHPAQSLDWMVCDMVEQPIRVAGRMAEWFAHGWCRHAIFNLKLPMKKRWQETVRCLELFEREAGTPLVVRAALPRPRGDHRLRDVARLISATRNRGFLHPGFTLVDDQLIHQGALGRRACAGS